MSRVACACLRVFLVWSWLLFVCAPGRAQPFAPTITPNSNPIAISTQPEKVAAARPQVPQQTVINVALGGTANGGNTKSYGGTLGGRLGFIRDRHQLTLEALGSMGGARQRGFTDVEWTSGNVVARARYDIFLSRYDALFVALAPRHDAFAGLDLRLQNQIGYLRNLFYFSDAHRFWSELGYDFTYDNFSIVEKTTTADITPEVAALNPALVPAGASISQLVKTREDGGNHFVHSARLFLGYTNRLISAANLSVGAETLFDLEEKRNVRVNGLVELTSSITQTFKLGLQARVLFDNVPVPGTLKYDTVTAMQLVYTFDSLAGTATTTCPACDCSAQVQAARNACKGEEPLRQITR